ncbi:MAG: hypothetical protein AB9872_17600 [Solidesulfovibrio sp.]
MVLGHAAVASLLQQFWLRRVSVPFCLAAAYGPDWIDKPLKLVFGLPGHGIAHSLIGSTLLLLLFWMLCRRLSLPTSWPAVVVLFWGLHLLCDAVGPHVFFWPFFGTFPVKDVGIAGAVGHFYFSRPLASLAWCDIGLTLLALMARLRPVLRLAPQ